MATKSTSPNRPKGWLAEARALVPDGLVARGHVVFDDSYADGLIKESARVEADLIVVGGSGGGLAGSYSLGSVVNELLHSSPVPVAVAPRGTRDSSIDSVREVTCAIGERQGADLLLDTAVRFSRAAGTPLRLVSLVALDPMFGTLRGDGAYCSKHAKNDHLDSKMLARLPLLHPEGLRDHTGDGPAEPLRRIVEIRSSIIQRRTAVYQRLDAQLELLGPAWYDALGTRYGKATLALLARYADPNTLIRLGHARLTRFLIRHSRGAWREPQAT